MHKLYEIDYLVKDWTDWEHCQGRNDLSHTTRSTSRFPADEETVFEK